MKSFLGKFALALVSTSALILTASSVAIAQDGEENSPSNTVDIPELTCRDLLLMDGDDEEATIVFIQGYISGKTSETVVDADAVRVSSDRSREQCVDEPDSTVLSVFEQNR